MKEEFRSDLEYVLVLSACAPIFEVYRFKGRDMASLFLFSIIVRFCRIHASQIYTNDKIVMQIVQIPKRSDWNSGF